MIASSLRPYFIRFSREIVCFWLVSFGNTVMFATNARPGMLAATSMLEVVALAWITVRLVLAEDGFRTSGGWRARPDGLLSRHVFPLGLALAVVSLPVVIRGIAFQRLFPEAPWLDFGRVSWVRLWIGWFLFIALPLKLFGMLILQGLEGRAKSAAWAALAVILLPFLGLTAVGFGKRQRDFNQSGGSGLTNLAAGIRQELAGTPDFIGQWNDWDYDSQSEVPAARLVARFSLDSTTRPPAVVIRSKEVVLRGTKVNVGLLILLNDPKLEARLERAVPVLRYADGTAATCSWKGTRRLGTPLPFLPATEWRFSGDFVSPLSLPEFEGDPLALTRNLELLFYEKDELRPEFEVESKGYRSVHGKDPEFHFEPHSMEELFTRQFPWPDPMWEETALPFLSKNSTREDLPFLLEKLRSDTRLADFFIAKGWTADAMPVLRELAKERIPMGAKALIALAGERDPALTADIAVLALDQEFDWKNLEPVLRAQPGFDWPKFAVDLWVRKKYSTNWLRPDGGRSLAALWAAQEGDFTAFRQTAEQAAGGMKLETARLPALVAGEHPNLMGYLRENIDRMKFDPTTRKWGL